MKNVMSFESYHDKKNYYETEPLREEINLSKIFKGKTKEEKRKKAIEIINNHPTKKELYNKLKKSNPKKAEKFVEFVMKKPYARYFKWDDKKEEFVDTARYTSNTFNFNY